MGPTYLQETSRGVICNNSTSVSNGNIDSVVPQLVGQLLRVDPGIWVRCVADTEVLTDEIDGKESITQRSDSSSDSAGQDQKNVEPHAPKHSREDSRSRKREKVGRSARTGQRTKHARVVLTDIQNVIVGSHSPYALRPAHQYQR